MSFSGDERGVSTVVGAILLFAIVIILIATWQAQVVPSQNSQVEIGHHRTVETDMQELRSDYIDAAETGTTRSQSVTLGTTYPDRTIFLNPAPVQGTIQTKTVDNGTILVSGPDNVSAVCGLDSDINTRSVGYDASYNYYTDQNVAAYRFEHSILYKRFGDGQTVVISDQELIQGNVITLRPMKSNFSKSGVTAKSVEFTGAATGRDEYTGPVNISIPTELSAEEWRQILSQQPHFENATPVTGSNRVKLVLDDTSWEVRCGAVGAGEKPDVTIPEEYQENQTGSVGNGSDTNFNPPDLRIENVDYVNNKNNVTLTLNNTGDTTVTLSQARIPVYIPNSAGQEPNFAIIGRVETRR